MSSNSNDVRLHRVLKAPPARVYRAFVEADALCQWLPPYGYTAKMHEFSAKVGGGYRMSFTNFANNQSHSFSVKFQELVPGEKICHTDQFDDPNLPEEMQVTILFRKVICGTEISILQENIPKQIPAEMCYLGWQESLLQLARLVELEIPNSI